MFNKIIDTTLKNNSNGIKIGYVRWIAKTAGPSPFSNERTELFLLGCKKALEGNPCKGCFNSDLWDESKQNIIDDPIKVAEYINIMAPNKYITIGGGEPTDQIDGLITLCKELKKYDFHIMIYTWRDLLNLENNIKDKFKELIKYVDIIVDGEFIEEEKMWDGVKEDGFISSIGSSNQKVWNIPKKYGIKMKDILKLNVTENHELQYVLKQNPKIYKMNF